MTASGPTFQTAIVANSDGSPRINEQAPVPQLVKPTQILVRSEAVAINPSDTKTQGDFVTAGGILGADYAGTVVAIGADVHDDTIGDRVAGAEIATHAQMPDRGAFGQCNLTSSKVCMKLSARVSTEAWPLFESGHVLADLWRRAILRISAHDLLLEPSTTADHALTRSFCGCCDRGWCHELPQIAQCRSGKAIGRSHHVLQQGDQSCLLPRSCCRYGRVSVRLRPWAGSASTREDRARELQQARQRRARRREYSDR